MIYAALGELVRKHRVGQEISQGALGKRVGLSRASVANIEGGGGSVFRCIIFIGWRRH